MFRRLSVILLGLLSACSPVDVLNALAPTEGFSVTSDVAYRSGPRPSGRQALDVYSPKQTNAPVVVFLYGGGWRDGRKESYRFLAAELARLGVVTVVPDYRVYPEVRFPGFLFDAAEAVAWTRRNIAQYGGDPKRLFVMGHSAGAHIAAMLTLDRQWLGRVGLDPDRDIAGMIGLAGPYDFLPLRDPVLQTIFAPAGDLRLSQPITFARGDAPPMFLASGMDDTVVLPSNTTKLADRIRGQGGRVEAHLYPSLGHAVLIGAFARGLRWTAPVLEEVAAFVRSGNGAASGFGAQRPIESLDRHSAALGLADRPGVSSPVEATVVRHAGVPSFRLEAVAADGPHRARADPPGV